jgi:hypothetical protein
MKIPEIRFASREEYVFLLKITDCPIQQMSKLQTNIATSLKEAEYTVLTIALFAAMPLVDVIIKFKSFGPSTFQLPLSLTQNSRS